MSKANTFLSDEKAQMGSAAIGAVITLIVIGVMLYIGISIMDGVETSAGLESGDTFYNTSTSITTGVETSFGLAGTLMLIIIAAAILTVLLGFVVLLR